MAYPDLILNPQHSIWRAARSNPPKQLGVAQIPTPPKEIRGKRRGGGGGSRGDGKEEEEGEEKKMNTTRSLHPNIHKNELKID